MSDRPLLPGPVSPPPSSGPGIRVEYLDFQDVEGHREYRFRVYGPDGSREFRSRIAKAAFDARRVRMQDGPDLCYQKLLRMVAAGVTGHPDVITIEDGDFSSYRDDHTQATKRRSLTPSWPATPAVAPRAPRKELHYRPRTPRTVSAPPPAAPLVANVEPALAEGQRVNHAVFGMGVTSATTSARTVVSFDRDGPKSFVTSMLEVEVLSAPHTWETSSRGLNRPCKTLGETTDSPI